MGGAPPGGGSWAWGVDQWHAVPTAPQPVAAQPPPLGVDPLAAEMTVGEWQARQPVYSPSRLSPAREWRRADAPLDYGADRFGRFAHDYGLIGWFDRFAACARRCATRCSTADHTTATWA